MPILDNSFTCSKGHSFTANAKIRARCPQCGELARRKFGVVDTKPKEDDPEVNPPKPDDPPIEHKEPVKVPTLVRRGRPRIMAKSTPKATPTKKAPTARKKAFVKKPVKALGKTASGIVRTHKVTRVTTPKVTRPPGRTAIARHIQIPRKESIIDSVMRRYGPG